MVCWPDTAPTILTPNVAAVEAVAVVDRAATTDAITITVAVGVGAIVAPAAPVALVRVAPVLVARATTTKSSVTPRPAVQNQHLSYAPGGRAHRSSARGISAPLFRLPQSVRALADREAPGTRVHAGRRAWVIPLALIVLALALSLPRLTTPAVYVFDELYYAYTAGKYVTGDEAYSTAIPPRDDPAIEWTHPPLAKLLIAGGILVAGDNPLGWRIASVLIGVAGVVIAYILALRLTGSCVTSGVAAGLLLMDGLYLIESRIGMSNLFVLVFANGALVAFSRVLTVAPERVGPPLLATGMFIGLGIATKWSGIALAGLIGLVLCWRTFQLWRFTRVANPSAADARAGLQAHLRWVPIAVVVLPLAIYLASYLHFWLTGHSWADFVALQRDMLAYHRNLGVVHDDSSPWWQWPLAARGVWYYVDEHRRAGSFIFANGNPILYWPMVVAVAWVVIDWWGRRSAALLILVIGFFGQWLPWAFSPRGTFIYHFMPVVPLGCMAIAIVLTGAWMRGGISRIAAAGYTLAVVATFAWFYPIYTAIALSPEQVDLRMWLASWRSF
jgi:dolichyl-phosphate-mannose-protein mannosyltransferase